MKAVPKLVPLGDLVEIRAGVGFPKDMQGRTSGLYPVFKVGDISRVVARSDGIGRNAENYVDEEDLRTLKTLAFPPETILFAKIGEGISLNRRIITAIPSIADNNVMGLVPTTPPCIDPKLLFYFMRGVDLYPLAVATSIPSIRKSDVERLSVPLWPPEEQRRVVAHLDTCFAHTKRAKQALDDVPALLDRLRKSILAAAFRGDLTADWRAENPDVEPASELLKRIRVERRRRWEEAELAKMVAKGKPPKDDRWKAKYVEPEPVDEEGLPELPEGWCWASVDEITTFVTSGSRGWSEFYSNQGSLFLRVANVPRDSIHIDLTDTQRVSPPTNAEGERTRVEVGDILITITADLGRVAVIEEDIEPAFVSQHVALARPITPECAPSWAHYLSSPLGQRLLLARNRGVTKAGLGLEDLRRTAIPILSSGEAKHLADRIEIAFGHTLTFRTELESAEQLRLDVEGAILGSAFTGTGR